MRIATRVASILWLVLGVCATLGLAGVVKAHSVVVTATLIWPGILAYWIGLPKGILWDAAHGPPFLSMIGIILVYFTAGSLALWISFLIPRRADTPPMASDSKP